MFHNTNDTIFSYNNDWVIKPFQLTPKTLVYRAYYKEHFVFDHMKEKTAINLVKLLADNGIVDAKTWYEASFSKVRVKYILATSDLYPYFPDIKR